MDSYTAATKDWLEQRYQQSDHRGVYRAHQPIYGFRVEPCEPASVRSYTITYHIARELAGLDFASFLDVGGSEGYKAALVRHLFGTPRVVTTDLSEQACLRARAIYGLEAQPIDIHGLPFADDSFDVVLCSETLEHVQDLQGAMDELLRVARRAVIVTVPAESPRTVAENIRRRIPHAHIHALTDRSFDGLADRGLVLRSRRILSSLLWLPIVFVNATRPRRATSVVAKAYGALCPLLRRVFGRRAAALLMRADRLAAGLPGYNGVVCTVLVDESCRRAVPRRNVTPADVLGFAVPHHELAAEATGAETTTPRHSGTSATTTPPSSVGDAAVNETVLAE